MACDFCGNTFNGYQPLLITVQESPSGDLLLYTNNQSRNIILITRMLLCQRYNGSSSVRYLRPDYPVATYAINYEKIEQGTTYLQYSTATTADSAQGEAEYTEVDGRSVSCVYNL